MCNLDPAPQPATLATPCSETTPYVTRYRDTPVLGETRGRPVQLQIMNERTWRPRRAAARRAPGPSSQAQRIVRNLMVTSIACSWARTSALYAVPMSVIA